MPQTPKKTPSRETNTEIALTELKPEDFNPVSRTKLGKSLAKLATAPKKKK